MSVNYLHGVETIEVNIGARPISVVKSAVIALIGYAPIGPQQQMVLVQSKKDAEQFGKQVPGFDIPSALKAIQAQGAGTVIVINVFDRETNGRGFHEDVEFNGNTATLSYPPIAGTLTVKTIDGDTTYVEGVDYTVSEMGVITRIPSGAMLSVAYMIYAEYLYFDVSTCTASRIEGEYALGERTGSVLLEEAFQTFGFTPRLFIANRSWEKEIANILTGLADKYRGHAIIDGLFEQVSNVIAHRGDSQYSFGTSSKRAFLVYPHLIQKNTLLDTTELTPYSFFMAGVIAATDNTDGYWYSPSNREIKGILGVSRTITSAVNDATTEANKLNEVGITTVFNSFGTGMRTWGNRCASFPTNTLPTNFISVQRTADILHESVERASLQFLDQPINNALIDSVRDSVNAFMGKLIQRGAIIDGECTYDPALNPPTEIAAGHIQFQITFMPPTPAERITFESFIDINLLASLGAN